MVFLGSEAPYGVINANVANWRRKKAATFSAGKGNEHEALALDEVKRRAQEHAHHWIDNEK